MIIIVLILFGLCLGSFVNALVYRLYESDKDSYKETAVVTKKQNIKKNKNEPNLSIWNGRSICPNCKHQLSALDLIPVFSWVYLRGRCRYCHNKISVQYPMVELTNALLFVLSYYNWPSRFDGYQYGLFIFWMIMLTGFMALVVYDIKWLILPNKLIFSLLCVYILQFFYQILFDMARFEHLVSSITGSLTIFGFFWLLYQISKGRWIGGGDVKLGVVLGALSGDVFSAILVIFLASLLGSVIGGGYLVFAKRFKLKAELPFGPYLIAATIIVFLKGNIILGFYTNLIGR